MSYFYDLKMMYLINNGKKIHKVIRSLKNFWHKYRETIKNVFFIFEKVVIIFAFLIYCFEINDRQSDREFRAWQIIYQASGKGGSGGLKTALEYLNKKGHSFAHIKLKGPVLDGINLEGAKMYKVNLEYARLKNANLRNADLKNTILIETDIRGADLRGADLRYANLGNAKFMKDGKFYLKIAGANVYGTAMFNSKFYNLAIQHGAVDIKGEGQPNMQMH